MPVLRMNMSECPEHVGEVDAAGDSGVLIDVGRIVVINKVVPERLSKNGPGSDYETCANPGDRQTCALFWESG